MVEQSETRRLAAILAADMVGYSRLMGADERGTIDRQKAHRSELIDQTISEYNGRIVKTTGDGMLVEFPSVVDAVDCAMTIQQAMETREAGVEEGRRISYRIGINLGDIVIDGDDIFGDGVNIAARLESLADPGGVCISRAARDQIRDKLDYVLDDLGEIEVKNIARPVRAFRVLRKGERPPARRQTNWIKYAAASAALLLLIAGGGYWWLLQPDFEPADPAKYAFKLPEKPSIAVLPFDNLSGDKGQGYLADGLSETIIAALAAIPEMFVIARNSSFTYKGKAVKVQQVAEELGVRYVLEGSIQQQGSKLRVTAQLVDAINGRHLWAERFDRDIADLFVVQDEITLQIVSALQVKLTDGKRAALGKGSTTNLEAWSHYVKGRALFFRITKEDNLEARELFQKAVALDPQFLWAWRGIGWTHANDARGRWSKSRAKSFELADEAVEKAATINPNDSGLNALRGYLALLRGKHDEAIVAGKKAIELSPSNPDTHAVLAISTYYTGDFNETVALVKKAMRLYPHHPTWYLARIGTAYMMLGQFDDAISALKARLADNPSRLGSMIDLATAYSMAGRMELAREMVSQVLNANPDTTLKRAVRRHRFKDPADLTRIIDALRAAGLPENPPSKKSEKPSIAVLPFANLSDDKKQEYFADGMTDDLITDLSRVSGLDVVARTSSFAYKGKNVKMQEIAKDLNVGYLLEGSVRRAGDQVRINAQLIDGGTGKHLWAETFDRSYENIFKLQDEVTSKITMALKVALTPEEKEKLARLPTKNLEAYDYFLKAEKLRHRPHWKTLGPAFGHYDKALALDPEFLDAHLGLAKISFRAWRLSWYGAIDPLEARRRTLSAIDHVLDLDPANADALVLKIRMQVRLLNHEKALTFADKAIRLLPDTPNLLVARAFASSAAGQVDAAKSDIAKAESLLVRPSRETLRRLAFLRAFLGDYEDSIKWALRYRGENPPSIPGALWLLVSYAGLGQMDKAKEELENVRKRWSWMSLAWYRVSYRHFKDQAMRDRFIGLLKNTGMPELPLDFRGDPALRLSNADLKKMFFDGPIERSRVNRRKLKSRWQHDGKGNFSGSTKTRAGKRIPVTGINIIKDNKLCFRIEATLMGREHCSEIYRYPAGTPDQSNEYIDIGIWGKATFSILPATQK